MTEPITSRDLSQMMIGAVTQIRRNHAWLSQLDSVAGDGDHGSTMLRTAECIERAFSAAPDSNCKTILHDAGWAILSLDGGASTSLFGTFFLGMADAPVADARTLDCSGMAAIFEAGLKAVQKQTKARPGDKTLMDALTPAVESLAAAASAGKEIDQALAEAAQAAKSGAASTTEAVARYGRSRQVGEKAKGHQDPGATSVALMFEGFIQGFTQTKENEHRVGP